MDTSYRIDGGFQPTAKRRADLDGPDFYPTPNWATHALLEHETFAGEIWECACGDGAMSRVLQSRGYNVLSSDLYNRGYGTPGIDFTTATHRVDNIVTNPPYHSAEGFVQQASKLARSKFALLLRLAFLEGARRSNTIFTEIPPSRVWVFSERITFYPAGADRAGSGTTAYAWFVWDREAKSTTELHWLRPGLRARFS